MKQLTVKELKEIINELSDDYKLYMHYDTFITDPIDDIEIDRSKKAVIFK